MNITETLIRSLATAESFQRGKEYFQSGAIFNTVRRENFLLAECEGSSAPAYQVTVELDEGGIKSTDCTCPYDWGGICKHTVALLLTYLHEPQAFRQQAGAAQLFKDLDRDTLYSLLLKIVERDPTLYDWLEIALETRSATAQAKQAQQTGTPPEHKRQMTVSEADYRRRVSLIFRSLDRLSSSQAYWAVSGIIQQLDEIAGVAKEFLNAGAGEDALVILMVLLEEVWDNYEGTDDSDGDLSYFLESLDQPLAETILSLDLEPKRQQQLKQRLTTLANEFSNYGIDDFGKALLVLKQGWGQDEDEEYYEDEDEYDLYDEDEFDLTEVKLNVLERQGRIEEFLALCWQTGHYQRYVTKLLQINRKDEAVKVALEKLSSSDDALVVAQRLRDLGDIQNALNVAERGLNLTGYKLALGNWLGPLEEAQGRAEQAFAAYHSAFIESPSLALYLVLKRLSGPRWPEVRRQAIQHMQNSPMQDALVDVYLEEQDWDAAIRVADKAGVHNYPLIEKVADGVLEQRPDWVIKAARQQAEGLIARTQSKYYAHAANWLEKVKKAYYVKGEKIQWQAYIDDLRRTYSRRPALQAELKRL